MTQRDYIVIPVTWMAGLLSYISADKRNNVVIPHVTFWLAMPFHRISARGNDNIKWSVARDHVVPWHQPNSGTNRFLVPGTCAPKGHIPLTKALAHKEHWRWKESRNWLPNAAASIAIALEERRCWKGSRIRLPYAGASVSLALEGPSASGSRILLYSQRR